ncbi:MAG: porin [Pseudomonadota bacterium]
MKTINLKKTVLASSIALILGGFSAQAAVADQSVRDEINDLKQRIEQLEMDLVDSQEAAKKQDRVKFSTKSGSPKMVSRDGKSSMELTGRVFLDTAALPSQYAKGEVEDLVGSQNASEFRKLYLGVEGELWGVWEYELVFDFAEQDVDLKDANIAYTGWDDQELKIGYQKPAFGLENTGSSRYTLFMERGLTDNFSPDRDLGLSWAYEQDWGGVKLGAFLPNSFIDGKLEDHTEGETEDGDELIPSVDSSEVDAITLTGRITGAPIQSSSQLLHLGGSVAHTAFKDPAKVKYDARPEVHLSEKLVASSVKGSDSTTAFGLEAAYSWKNLLLQGEYVHANIDAGDSFGFDSYYLAGAYMLTGESHPYKAKSGKFGQVRPDNPVSAGGWGAWEVALRYSAIDLNDGDELGGRMEDFTVGLNWYPENNLKAQLNYIHYDAKDYEDDSDFVARQKDDIVQARLAWYF